MEVVLLLILIAAALAAVFARRLRRKLRVESGLPVTARVVYSDTGAWRKLEQPLFSRRYLLTGRPDYIVEENRTRIPVEVKPNRTDPEPRLADTLQLAAYGLLIEEAFDARPEYGLLKYRDAVFRVEFTTELRAQLLELLSEMRRDLEAEDVPRSHDEPRRCRACGYRAECGQELE